MRCTHLAIVSAFASIGMHSIAFAQDASVKVSLTVRASRTPVVLDELSKVSHVKLEATPLTQNEVLVVSVHDVPLADVMKRIAIVTAGEWKPIDGGFRLVADVTERARQARAEEKARIDRLNASIKKRTDALAKQSNAAAAKPGSQAVTKSDANVAVDMSMMFGGSNPAILKLILGLNRSLLAAVGKGDRVVFSTNPTAMQRPLASNAIEIINEFVAEHNKTVSKTKQGIGNELNDPTLAMLPEAFRKMAERGTKRIENASKALLIVSKQSFFGMLSCELRIYDANGKVVGSESTSIDEGDFSGLMEIANAARDAAAATQPQEKPGDPTPIVYSEDSKAFDILSSGARTGMIKVSPTTLAKIYTPKSFDPLSFAATDEMLALANASHLPLVANLPDSQMSIANGFTKSESRTAGTVMESLKKGKEIKRVEDQGWLTVAPAEPQYARDYRLDRTALETLMQATKAKGVASLDDVAAYALKAENPMEGGIGQVYLMEFIPGAMQQGMDGMTNWDMVRFYGLLSPEARSTLARGGRIPISGLGGQQSSVLARMVYGAGGHIEVSRPGDKPESNDPFMRMIMQFSGGTGGGTDYQDEPTESLATGLPGSGFVEMSGTVEPTANPIPTDGSIMVASAATLGADELAIIKMITEDKNMSAAAEFMPKFDKVKIGERTKMHFTFRFTPSISLSESLMDHRLASDAATATMNALPSNFTKLIDERAAALKKSPFGAMMSGFGALGGAGTIKP